MSCEELIKKIPSGHLHDQGLEKLVDLEQKIITIQRTLDLIKENMYCYPSLSWLSYTQQFVLKCGVVEDGRSTILFNIVPDYEFSIICGHETTHVSPCISTTMLLSNSDEMRAPLFLEHSKGSFTHEALEGQMIDGRHIVMESTFHCQDEVSLMSISQLKEESLPTTCMEPYGFQWAFDERISWRDLNGGALQHFME